MYLGPKIDFCNATTARARSSPLGFGPPVSIVVSIQPGFLPYWAPEPAGKITRIVEGIRHFAELGALTVAA